MTKPLISCMCVSQAHRWPLLQRAMLDFAQQTYDAKELVIVAGTPDYANTIQSFADVRLPLAPIRILTRTLRTQLEGLQFAQMAANGQVLTLWDDDNLNHPERLAYQFESQSTTKTHITALSSGLYYFYRDSELFIVSLKQGSGKIQDTVLPTSIMAYREHFPVLDHTVRIDTAEQLLVSAIRRSQRVRAIPLEYMHMVTVVEHPPGVRKYSRHREIAEKNAQPRITSDVVAALDKFKWADRDVSVQCQRSLLLEYSPKNLWEPTLQDVVASDANDTKQTEE